MADLNDDNKLPAENTKGEPQLNETPISKDKANEIVLFPDEQFSSFFKENEEAMMKWAAESNIEIKSDENNNKKLNVKGKQEDLGRLMRKFIDSFDEFLSKSDTLKSESATVISKDEDSAKNSLKSQTDTADSPSFNLDELIKKAEAFIDENWQSEIKISKKMAHPFTKNTNCQMSAFENSNGFFAWLNVPQDDLVRLFKEGLIPNGQPSHKNEYFCFSPDVAQGYASDCHMMVLFFIIDGENVTKFEKFFCAVKKSPSGELTNYLPLVVLDTQAADSEISELETIFSTIDHAETTDACKTNDESENNMCDQVI